jgi:L-fuculose-phosphate aldolase
MSDYLAQRRQLVSACLLLAQQGYLAGTGGNLALRLDETHFAVTPSATDYYRLGATDVAVLRLDTLEQVGGGLPPSVESGLHAAMLRNAPHLCASVHTHQPLASAVSLGNVALPLREAWDIEALGAATGLIGYAPSGTGMLVRALRRGLRPHVHAYLLRNHGVICRAPTLDAAVELLGHIERAAAAFLRERASLFAPATHPLRALALGALAEGATP